MQEPIFFNQDLVMVSTSRVSLAIRVLLSKYRLLKHSTSSKRVALSKATQTQVRLVEEVLELMELGGPEEGCDLAASPCEVQYEVFTWPPPPLVATSREACMASHPCRLWPEALEGVPENDMPALMDKPQELETPEKESAPRAQKSCPGGSGGVDFDAIDLAMLEHDVQIHDSAHHAISKHMKKCQATAKASAVKSEASPQAKSVPPGDRDGALKKSRKNEYSRKYHQVLSEKRKLGLPEEEAKEKARKAARKAVRGDA